MSSKKILLDFNTDGTVTAIYSDDLAGLLATASKVSIKRASHVEPTEDGKWTADMAPSGGPVLGPFNLRGEALDAEQEWLLKNVFHTEVV
jgi:hypothetical protein